MLNHFSLIPIAEYTGNAGSTAATEFTFQAPVSCKFASLQVSSQSTSTSNYVTASLAVNGTTIVTGDAVVTGKTVYETSAVDSGQSDLILDTDEITLTLSYTGTAASVLGIAVKAWANAKPRA